MGIFEFLTVVIVFGTFGYLGRQTILARISQISSAGVS